MQIRDPPRKICSAQSIVGRPFVDFCYLFGSFLYVGFDSIRIKFACIGGIPGPRCVLERLAMLIKETAFFVGENEEAPDGLWLRTALYSSDRMKGR